MKSAAIQEIFKTRSTLVNQQDLLTMAGDVVLRKRLERVAVIPEVPTIVAILIRNFVNYFRSVFG